MSSFNPFNFMNNRSIGLVPSEIDKNSFNLFMCQLILSMTTCESVINILDKINTNEFFSLPKHIQCLSFTTFDGNRLSSKWKKSKIKYINDFSVLVNKAMKVFKLSHNDAVSCIKNKTIDIKLLNDLYNKLTMDI